MDGRGRGRGWVAAAKGASEGVRPWLVAGLIDGVEMQPNMESMLGRNAAPRGVEKKSTSGSNSVNTHLAMGGLGAKLVKIW